MNADKKITERRAHKRLPIKERVLVFIIPSATGSLYHVVDIAEGGLAFRYIGKEEMTGEISRLSMLVGDNLWLDSVPVSPSFDVPINNGYIPMRKKGIRFGSLSSIQKNKLQDFLQRTAAGRNV
ncbi:MAG: PilZ domain-containing protein [Deltaproteobacteria bacterium]|nr:PilZ domain-containing protein [Deltaproteobacteria bacterium]